MRILVIEDNPKVAGAIQQGLSEHGYAVHTETRGFQGEDEAVASEYDVIVLDLMLPDRNGVDICRSLRQRGVTTPVLMLTGLSGASHTVTGLDAGADDYLTKPFEFDELVARVRALLRRGQATEATHLNYDDLELDLRKRVAKRNGEKIKLSGREFSLLEYLMRNPDRVLSRTSIAEQVWDMNYEPTSNVIDVYISTLRRKIDEGSQNPLIHTVIGTGYRFGREEDTPR